MRLRRWLLLLVALIGIGSTLRLHQSRAQTEPPDLEADLVVLTYNVWNNNRRYDDIAAVIRDSGADVVLIQEVSANFEPAVIRSLANVYPHSAAHYVRPDRLALAILSKTPLGNISFSVFSPNASRLRAEVRVNERVIILYNVHLPNPSAAFLRGEESAHHNRAVDALLRLLDAEPRAPLIVGGDFNMLPSGSAYERISARFIDAFARAGVGGGATFPANALLPAVIQIDYIFHTDDFTPISARVLPDAGGSDHHPVIAALALAD